MARRRRERAPAEDGVAVRDEDFLPEASILKVRMRRAPTYAPPHPEDGTPAAPIEPPPPAEPATEGHAEPASGETAEPGLESALDALLEAVTRSPAPEPEDTDPEAPADLETPDEPEAPIETEAPAEPDRTPEPEPASEAPPDPVASPPFPSAQAAPSPARPPAPRLVEYALRGAEGLIAYWAEQVGDGDRLPRAIDFDAVAGVWSDVLLFRVVGDPGDRRPSLEVAAKGRARLLNDVERLGGGAMIAAWTLDLARAAAGRGQAVYKVLTIGHSPHDARIGVSLLPIAEDGDAPSAVLCLLDNPTSSPVAA